MHVRKVFLIIFLNILLIYKNIYSDETLIGTTSNNFLKIQLPARPAAIGESYVALADDINSIFYNPAGIGKSMLTELSFTHAEWFQQIRYENLSFLIPFSFGNIAGAINFLNISTMDKTLSISPLTYTKEYTFTPYSLNGILTYAKEFTDNLFVGLNLKFVNYTIDSQDENGSSFSILSDIGLIYDMPFLKGFSTGLVFKNLGPSSKFISENYMQPIDMKVGLAYAMDFLALSADIAYPLDNNLNFYLGGEINLFEILSIRAGYKGGTINQPTFGAGINYARFFVDYAFVPYSEENLGITHRITASYKFGAPESKIIFNPKVFSPNNDKFVDYSFIQKDIMQKNKVKNYILTIYNELNEPVIKTSKLHPDTKLFWNGFDSFKKIVPDGTYYGKLETIYLNGIKSESNIASVTVDNTPPEVKIDANPKMVKPGQITALYAPVKFSPAVFDLHGISKWKLIIYTADNKIFKTFEGTGEPKEITWDGSDNTGLNYVNTGTTYYYIMYAADSVGNWGKSISDKVKVLLREIVITLSSDTLFDLGKADVKISVYNDLKKVANKIKSLNNPTVVIEGHTDNLPLYSSKYKDNQELSEYRAKAVGRFLVELFNIKPEIISTVGLGDTQPVASNDTPEGRKKNRRVTIRIKTSKWE
ncbi:MAG: PorV/PorQ family protein [Candidatus Goldbacteria bacterium]|nr:PorV/PorQ family protein [Candidatus Goldiibacteriota bacterium]